ncbi:MAG: type II toxin-antitoxin system VapB family antitoxin [Gammaproteobacteria bacterium]|nr:type II toxin-antitoxin system VapB family antitoxin [Gammaproteobacteria bacterium]
MTCHACDHAGILIPRLGTTVVIDDQLMKEVLRATGLKTKREAVEIGLRTLLRIKQQEEIRRFRGKLDWQGNPEET